MTKTLIAVVGPTVSGKTRLGIELARRYGGEIIGADSRQVYRLMDIGTAKPTADERSRAPHHLIDIIDPDEPFSLGQWLDLANEALDRVWADGKQPILVGGTGQYVWSLIEGWRVPRVAPQPALRKELSERAPEDLLAELRRVDPEAESFIDPRNVRRVIRALEVYAETGKPFTYWRRKDAPGFKTVVVGLRVPRDALYERIDARVDAMIAGGMVGEVRSLLERGYSRELPSMSGIGYGEMCALIAGEVTLEEATEQMKTRTHGFARHQNSWFKPSDERIRWIDGPEDGIRTVDEALGSVGAAGRTM
ncbi:MAG: tRNA (adenosine(37)-N6)-dimethylallyltransferase MiaA [Chloroflexi bacterium]|nr:tRNA (adenosine(37)-N6)-dimethylallyltransferase MiaA [Chloroflexota bacterium]